MALRFWVNPEGSEKTTSGTNKKDQYFSRYLKLSISQLRKEATMARKKNTSTGQAR
jgi:hypothetical protein